MKNLRIGNVEYRQTPCVNSEDIYEEIVYWYQNNFYSSEDRLKSEGWEFDEDGNAHKDNSMIHSSFFEGKEHCFTVAYVLWNSNYDEFDVKSVGCRAFELNVEDFKDFKAILRHLNSYNGDEELQ